MTSNLEDILPQNSRQSHWRLFWYARLSGQTDRQQRPDTAEYIRGATNEQNEKKEREDKNGVL